MRCLRATVLVGVLLGTAAVASAQARGGRIPAPPIAAGRIPAPSRPTMPAPPASTPRPLFEARIARERPPFAGVHHRFFIPWFGYFHSIWLDDFSWDDADDRSGALDSAAVRPLPPIADGVPAGGLQLDVEPHRAQVFVDGFYAGITDDFRGYYHHLDLTAGRHRVDLLLAGYPPQTLDVIVTPGRTLTYRGTLGSSVLRVD